MTIKQKTEQKIKKIENYRRNNFLKILFSQYYCFSNMNINLTTLNLFSNNTFDEFQYVLSINIKKNSFLTQHQYNNSLIFFERRDLNIKVNINYVKSYESDSKTTINDEKKLVFAKKSMKQNVFFRYD